MRLNVVLRYMGLMLLLNAGFMLLSACISLFNNFDTGFYPLLLSFLLTSVLGVFPLIFVPKGEHISTKEGYGIVVGSWLAACMAGMMPYMLWGGEFSLINAWFESVSGYTTTGSTILNDVEALSQRHDVLAFGYTLAGRCGCRDVRIGRTAGFGSTEQDETFAYGAFIDGQG